MGALEALGACRRRELRGLEAERAKERSGAGGMGPRELVGPVSSTSTPECPKAPQALSAIRAEAF